MNKYKPMTEFKDRVYRLKKTPVPLSMTIATADSSALRLLAPDAKGVQRSIRFATNQESPFVHEQEGEVLREQIVFERGFLTVKAEERALQQFLAVTPHNKTLFEEVDAEGDAQKELDKVLKEDAAVLKVAEMSDAQIEDAIRLYGGINNKANAPTLLRLGLRNYAKQDPDKFLRIVDDPAMRLHSQVQQLFDETKITVSSGGRNGRVIKYNLMSKNGELDNRVITNIPPGRDNKVEFLVEYLRIPENKDLQLALVGLIGK